MNLDSLLRKTESQKKMLLRRRKRLLAEQQRQASASAAILSLEKEIRSLEDEIMLNLCRIGKTADESMELLSAGIPAPAESSETTNPTADQEQDAPETEVNLEKTE